MMSDSTVRVPPAPHDWDPPSRDPWWDVFVPATFGETGTVLEAVDTIETTVPAELRADYSAVSARALAVMGRFGDAERLGDRALRLGGREADALATFFRAGGEPVAVRRMEVGERRGERADAACDLACLRLHRNDARGAGEAVERAADLCRGHAEAARWRRFLEEAADPCALVSLDPQRARRACSPVARDAADLVPRRRGGWISTERVHRRVLGAPGPEGWAEEGSGLRALQDAGVMGFHFAVEREYRGLDARHPLVGLEGLADEVRSRVYEGREAMGAARRLWDRSGALDDVAAADAANLIVALATQDTMLAPLGWAVADRMIATARVSLWQGYRAWLGWLLGRFDAASDARAVIAMGAPDPIGFTLAVATLQMAGFRSEADAAIQAGLLDPALRASAEEARRRRSDPPRVVVSGRMTPRGGGAGN